MIELSDYGKLVCRTHKESIYHWLHGNFPHHSIVYPKEDIYILTLLYKLDYLNIIFTLFILIFIFFFKLLDVLSAIIQSVSPVYLPLVLSA